MLVSLVSLWMLRNGLNASAVNHTETMLTAGCECTADLISLTFLNTTTFCDNGTELCMAVAFATRRRRAMATDDQVLLEFIILSLTPYTLPASCSNYTIHANIPVEYTPGMSKRTLAAKALNPLAPTPTTTTASSTSTVAIIAAVAVVAVVGGVVWGVRKGRRKGGQLTLERIQIEPGHIIKDD